MAKQVTRLGEGLCTAGHIAFVSASPVNRFVDGCVIQRAKNMISDTQGYRSGIFAFGEMSVGEGAPSRTNYMILDTQGHCSHISAPW